ncbi:NSFL1 cofactor p47 [Nephila pilipes]|uniref:NSFL1 cofactor p47 n=1 Tax=Nephila pilipes TaxID=299642 RepID=A0A8X6QSF1_NEPPI|nr:NSFL1 cofactor p47 [Nephila pilipes]
MADSDRSKLIEEFCKVTGTDATRAQMYLQANGWDSDLAMSSYFEEAEEEPESENAHSEFLRPGSPKPAAAPPNTSRIATFASLANNAEKDEEEGQAFYAGGSERSGQQVLGPGKRKAAGNEVVEAMFKAVRKFGGEVLDSPSKRCSKTKLKAFKGAGYVLGSTEGTSDSVPGNSQEGSSREVEVCLQLWQTGFTVDGGPLRDYNAPDSKGFLEAIRKGEIPEELMSRGGKAEIHLNIEDHTHEEYIPKKPTVQAFSGTGFRLGNITPVVQSETKPSEQDETTAQENLKLDESKPITTVQIRLADGTRLMMKANHCHTIGDVRRYIVTARPEYSASVFSLMTAFPTKELNDDEATLEAENLLNSVIVQKLK